MNTSINAVVAIAIAILVIVAVYGLASGALNEIEDAVAGGDDNSIDENAKNPDGEQWNTPGEISLEYKDKDVMKNG